MFLSAPQTSDLAVGINSTTGDYLHSLGTNLSDFTDEVTSFYNSALPLDSQPQVELYLGARCGTHFSRSTCITADICLLSAGHISMLSLYVGVSSPFCPPPHSPLIILSSKLFPQLSLSLSNQAPGQLGVVSICTDSDILSLVLCWFSLSSWSLDPRSLERGLHLSLLWPRYSCLCPRSPPSWTLHEKVTTCTLCTCIRVFTMQIHAHFC